MDAARLFEQHHESLLRYLVRLTGDVDAARDAAQEAFARLVEKPPRNEQPRAWLFTVATNVVRARANMGRRRAELLAGAVARAPHADPEPSPEQVAESESERARVRAALDALPEKEKVMLLMREEGFSHREIAAAVGTTTGSVGTMLARALDRLAALLPLDATDE
jgi:RNA polymerase sigma-70 factor (ECF subfamily)